MIKIAKILTKKLKQPVLIVTDDYQFYVVDNVYIYVVPENLLSELFYYKDIENSLEKFIEKHFKQLTKVTPHTESYLTDYDLLKKIVNFEFVCQLARKMC